MCVCKKSNRLVRQIATKLRGKKFKDAELRLERVSLLARQNQEEKQTNLIKKQQSMHVRERNAALKTC